MEKVMKSQTKNIVKIGDRVQVKPCAKYYPNYELFYNINKTKESFPFYLNLKVDSMMKGIVINIARDISINTDIALVNIEDNNHLKRTILIDINSLAEINDFKFKVGDKVKKIRNSSALMSIGDEGIVSEVSSGVEKKELLKIEGKKGTFDASNFEKVSNEIEMNVKNLNTKQPLAIGDKVVRVSNTWNGMKVGDVGTIKNINYLANVAVSLDLVEFKGVHAMKHMIKLNENFNRYKDSKISKLEKEVKKLKKKIVVEKPKEIDNDTVMDIASTLTLSVDAFAERMGDRINVKFLDEFGNTLAKGSSKKHANDEFDLEIGLQIAMTRAIISYQKKQLHKFINKTK